MNYKGKTEVRGGLNIHCSDLNNKQKESERGSINRTVICRQEKYTRYKTWQPTRYSKKENVYHSKPKLFFQIYFMDKPDVYLYYILIYKWK